MARTVKPEEVASKRRAILDATQRLVLTKGYEQMSIQDILDEVQMSSGAFHHYFDSRKALLEAFIERIKRESEKPLLSIIHDPGLSAIEKLQGFFNTLDRLRVEHKTEVVRLGRVWYTDANAIVRQKVDDAVFQQRAPLLTEIVRQGVQEGCFTIAYPNKAGEVILSLLQGMGNTHARLLLSLDQKRDDDQHLIEEIVTIHAAYMDAIERMLGAPPHSFYRTDIEAVNIWVVAMRENSQV
ncbi:MAG: TetR/AcrR family transcriptional regulator [Ktedonobacteraceae bacterium]|nr:TetR/AcrR family transcriptional regulator [Ktedonobacteraceae bacterium]